MKPVLKAVANAISLALMLLPAALSGFGRIAGVFTCFGQAVSLVPGIPGNYLRIAYYFLTLKKCPLNSRISFGTFLNKPGSVIGEKVYIGSWCVIAQCNIGDRTQIGDHVQVPSGRRQHPRDAEGRIGGSDQQSYGTVAIGADCWIGSGAIVMENVGPRCTIGAGAVVTRPVVADTVAAGNPAREIRRAIRSNGE